MLTPARRDTLRSLASPGAVSRAMGGLFGLGSRSQLADPRLEALRRMAVYAWRRGFALPMTEIRAFLAAGFVEAQMETLVVSVTGMRVGATTRAQLTAHGLVVDEAARFVQPLGPVLRARRAMLRRRGLLTADQDTEEIVVIRARRATSR